MAATGAAPERRPIVLKGTTTVLTTERGELCVTVSTDSEGVPVEVFGRMGKAGSFEHGVTELACRLITLALRSGAAPREIVAECQGISEMQPFPNRLGEGETAMVLGLGDGIAHVLRRDLDAGRAETGGKGEET